jgi:uncharacterized phiE125 gp8 family phage protein
MPGRITAASAWCRRRCARSTRRASTTWLLPAPGRIAGGIELDVTVGYGDAATDVPEALRQAVRLLVAHWYENRGVVATDTTRVAPLPSTITALLAPYRMLRL